jgi:hypothetical protein
MKVEEVSLEDYSRLCNPYQVKYDRMFDRVLDNRKVLSVTGTRQDEFAELPTALPQELESFKAHPVYRTCNVVQNALMDRWCGMRINRTNLSAREKILYFRNLYPLFGHAVLLAALPIRVLRKLK